mgnify:CR=1 FL=1|tara:strand:- start:393 stop:1214 length:822 start_codon:yes stop_codon:yes gene_type:complete
MGCGCNNNFNAAKKPCSCGRNAGGNCQCNERKLNAKGRVLKRRRGKGQRQNPLGKHPRLPKEGENLKSFAKSIGYDINVVSGREGCDCTCSGASIETISGSGGGNTVNGWILKCKRPNSSGCKGVCGKVLWDEPYGARRGVLNVEYYSKSQIQNDGVAERETDCCSGDTCGATMYCPDGSSRHFEACCYGNKRCSDFDFNCSTGKATIIYDNDLPLDKRLLAQKKQFSGFMGEEYYPQVNVRDYGFDGDSYYEFNDKYSMYRGINKNDLITDF